MGKVETRNIGALCLIAGISSHLVAGGAANSENGASIDRLPQGGSQRFDSCVAAAVVSESTALAAGQSATLSSVLEESVDDSVWTTVADVTIPDVVITNGGTVLDSLDHDINLLGAQRYVRVVSTLTVTAGAGSATAAGLVVLGGAAVKPT